MTSPARRDPRRVGLWLARTTCLLVAVAPVIGAAVAAPVADPPASSIAAKQGADLPSAEQQETRADAALRDAERRVEAELTEIGRRSHLAVSVRDLETGSSFDRGAGRFRTASLVKVHLAALMVWRADRSPAGLTELQRKDLRAMLVRSDNAAALRTYTALGGPPGIEKGLENAFGESRIRVGESSYWGRSTTTPRDVVALMDVVLSTDRPAARQYGLLQTSMARVVPDQRWGISALADAGSEVLVKVGWVRSPTGWVVNSSGRVLIDGSPVLISVMTDRNRTLDAGIEATEAVARSMRAVVRAQREHADAVSRTPGLLGPCFASVLSGSPC